MLDLDIFIFCLYIKHCSNFKTKGLIVFDGKTHARINTYSLIAIAFVLMYFDRLDITFLDFICGAYVGCLLPDIDHKISIAGAICPAWHFLNHGTVTHTLLFNIALVGIYYYLLPTMAMAGIAWGVFNHCFGDHFDGYALKYWFYPYVLDRKGKKKKYK
jgi:hypothetical protein